ncbi:MAG: hypothetical protein PVI54_18360 [Desulfobacteraceae bacterium]
MSGKIVEDFIGRRRHWNGNRTEEDDPGRQDLQRRILAPVIATMGARWGGGTEICLGSVPPMCRTVAMVMALNMLRTLL